MEGMQSQQRIGSALAPIMKANGYRKRRLTWHKNLTDTILVFHVEKNRWGADQYSFHCGIYLRSFGRELHPPQYRCQIEADIENLVPDKFECRQMCDFAYGVFSVSERLDWIVENVSKVALPWLDRYSSLSALRQLATNYQKQYPHVIIWIDALDYLLNTTPA